MMVEVQFRVLDFSARAIRSPMLLIDLHQPNRCRHAESNMSTNANPFKGAGSSPTELQLIPSARESRQICGGHLASMIGRTALTRKLALVTGAIERFVRDRSDLMYAVGAMFWRELIGVWP